MKIKYNHTITFGELLISFILMHIMLLMSFIGLAILTTGWFGIIMLLICAIILIIISHRMGNGLKKIIGNKTSLIK